MATLKQIRQIMKKYGCAWEKKDSGLLLDCFASKGVYQESPLAKPYRGQQEIKKFWDKVVKQETTKIKFKVGKCYISKGGETGFAEWQCTNLYKGRKHNMVGIMILKLKKGKITYLNEYWNTKIN